MAWLPDWMAALGSHGAARNAARAIDGPRAAALAVEHQLAALAPLGARSLAGPAPAEQPSLSPPAATHATRAATAATPGRTVEQPEVLGSPPDAGNSITAITTEVARCLQLAGMAPFIAPRQAGLVRRFARRSPTVAALTALRWLLTTPPRPVLALVRVPVRRTTRWR